MTAHDPGAVEALAWALGACGMDGMDPLDVALESLAAAGWHLSRTPSPLDRLQEWATAAPGRKAVITAIPGNFCVVLEWDRTSRVATGPTPAEAMTAALDAANNREDSA